MTEMRHAKKEVLEQPIVDSAPKKRGAPRWHFMLALPIAFLWMELMFRVAIHKVIGSFFGVGLLYTFGFTVAAAALVYLLCTLFSPKVNFWITVAFLSLAAAVLTSEIIYAGIFGELYDIDKMLMAGEAIGDFGKDTIPRSLFQNLLYIVGVWLPMIVYCIFGKLLAPAHRAPAKFKIFSVLTTVVVHALMVLIILCTDGYSGPRYWYISQFNSTASAEQFGMLTTFRLDLRYKVIDGVLPPEQYDEGSSNVPDLSDKLQEPEQPDDPSEEPKEEPVIRVPQVIDSLDFEALAAAESNKTIKQMHEYFGSVQPTMTNEYTGMFEGKNLIFIVAEGFSPYAVSEELTPTLYQLSHEGIQCTNYYTPGWGVSTSDGEYTSLLGLIPATGVKSMAYSADRNMYFSLGNQLKAQGYNTYAYHNHTYTYYDRHKSHPNLGYDYKGIGNGLELDYSDYYPGKNTKTRWPNSDYLMAKATVDEYMSSEEPFHTYYLTVSGHMLYTFMGNSMASYHKAKVADLPYSDEVKAYLACQIELDLMVEELIRQLEERGIAEDTVIVLTADHYPYGLQQNNAPDYYSELAGYDTGSTFEKYRNTLIMWHKGMESIVIDEPTYSIDLLPTLCNLFGLDYDSRLLIGRDFLSDASALVCFSNRSWVTEYGRYDAPTKTFTLTADIALTEEEKKAYVDSVNTVVRRKFTYSDQILKQDYYDILFGD